MNDRQSSRARTARTVRAVVVLHRELELATRQAEISMGQYRILLMLRTGPWRAGEIAAAASLKRPTVSVLLNGLRERGWIEDSIDPVDGRVTRVELTSAGLAKMKAFERQMLRHFETLFRGEDIASLHGCFSDVYEMLGRSKEARFVELERRWLGGVDEIG